MARQIADPVQRAEYDLSAGTQRVYNRNTTIVAHGVASPSMRQIMSFLHNAPYRFPAEVQKSSRQTDFAANYMDIPIESITTADITRRKLMSTSVHQVLSENNIPKGKWTSRFTWLVSEASGIELMSRE